jgi:hypothetical protein
VVLAAMWRAMFGFAEISHHIQNWEDGENIHRMVISYLFLYLNEEM